MASAFISIHAPILKAVSIGTTSAPLSIETSQDSAFSHAEVTFYCGDFALARKLADAINETIAAHKASLNAEAA